MCVCTLMSVYIVKSPVLYVVSTSVRLHHFLLYTVISYSALNVCQFNPVHQLFAAGSDKVRAVQFY